MSKIVVIENGVILQEMLLLKERTTIGRRPHNDIVIPDPAISGEHAVIVTFFNDAILEDMNSTNGTQVNGQPVKKHFLQHDDEIEIGQHKLRYVSEARQEVDSALCIPGRVAESEPGGPTAEKPSAARRSAAIKILNGPNAGKLVVLAKALTTIGSSGGTIAVIAAGEGGYSIAHVEGGQSPIVNGSAIGKQAQPLAFGDVIEVSGTRIGFSAH